MLFDADLYHRENWDPDYPSDIERSELGEDTAEYVNWGSQGMLDWGVMSFHGYMIGEGSDNEWPPAGYTMNGTFDETSGDESSGDETSISGDTTNGSQMSSDSMSTADSDDMSLSSMRWPTTASLSWWKTMKMPPQLITAVSCTGFKWVPSEDGV
ncbi:hypothetical protein CGCF413_v006992 [Colletotrichum fructicola]|nr:hypothetical protein CFRS1_v003796 [Colletotrichum fructicola]KAF5498439.1 hypothetical protein CGCF413_v006992 [Colletotrichum fructicola]